MPGALSCYSSAAHWLVLSLSHPQTVQQYSEFPCDCNDSAFAGVFSASFRQFAAPNLQSGGRSKWPKNVVGTLNK